MRKMWIAAALALAIPGRSRASEPTLGRAFARARRAARLERMRRDPAREATLWVLNSRRGKGAPHMAGIDLSVSREFWDSSYPNKRIAWIENFKGLRDQILAQYKEGRRIRRLIISAHGSPGSVWNLLNPEDLEAPSSSPLSLAFAPGAVIFFQSCSIGAGDKGRRFMALVARQLLSANGGWVVAPRGVYWWVFGKGSGSDRSYRKCRVYPGGRAEFVEPADSSPKPLLGLRP